MLKIMKSVMMSRTTSVRAKARAKLKLTCWTQVSKTEESAQQEEVGLEMLTSFMLLLPTRNIDGHHVDGKRDGAKADNDPPIDDQRS